jgi:hypothetical protein
MCKYTSLNNDYINKVNEFMDKLRNSFIFIHSRCIILYAKDKLSKNDIIKLLLCIKK